MQAKARELKVLGFSPACIRCKISCMRYPQVEFCEMLLLFWVVLACTSSRSDSYSFYHISYNLIARCSVYQYYYSTY